MIKAIQRPFENIINTHLLPRYQELESREQKIIIAAAILLPLFIMVFGMMLPLQDKQHALQQSLKVAQTQAAEADQLVTYLKKHAAALKSNTHSSDNLLTNIERLARQTNIRAFITRIKPQTSLKDGQQSLMLQIKNVPYKDLIQFIHALAQQGMGLKSLKLQSTNTPGLLQVHAIISA